MMAVALFLFGAFACGYLFGLFPSGPWVARRKLGGVALTDVGSGGTGATNVLRYAGWGRAVAVVLLDVAKAVAAILVARYAAALFVLGGGSSSGINVVEWGEVCAAIGALSGHCFPVWSRGFRGGKGVASSMGILLMLAPGVSLAAALLWGGMLWMWGFSSVASLGVCVFLLAVSVLWGGGALSWGMGVIVAIVVWRHRENIVRLRRGEERRVFGKKKGRA